MLEAHLLAQPEAKQGEELLEPGVGRHLGQATVGGHPLQHGGIQFVRAGRLEPGRRFRQRARRQLEEFVGIRQHHPLPRKSPGTGGDLVAFERLAERLVHPTGGIHAEPLEDGQAKIHY